MRVACALMFGVALYLLALPSVVAEQANGLTAIAAEPKLEKRAKKALSYAHKGVGRVVKAYQAGNVTSGEQLLKEIQQAVELAKESLETTGKNPRKRPKSFKKLEIGTRRLIDALGEIGKEMNYDERDVLVAVQNRIAKINHELVVELLSKKK